MGNYGIYILSRDGATSFTKRLWVRRGMSHAQCCAFQEALQLLLPGSLMSFAVSLDHD